MQMDYEGVLSRIVDGLRADGRVSDVRGELTGERGATRAQMRVFFTYNGEERCFLYHIQREGPVHTVARSMVEDTLWTLPQRIFQPTGGVLQPNDVYYPSALGLLPNRIPGMASAPAAASR